MLIFIKRVEQSQTCGWCSASSVGIIMLLLCATTVIFHLLLMWLGPFAQPLLTLYPLWDQTQHLTGSLLRSNWIPKVLVKKKKKCRLYSRLLGGNLEDDNAYYKAKLKKNSPFKHLCSFSKVPLSTRATSSLLPAQIFSMTFGSFSSHPDTSSLGFTFLGRQGG